MSKYDWSNVPEWVNWIFTCPDGEVWGADNKPCDREGFHGDLNDKWDLLWVTKNVEDWQESLEERPNEH